MSFWRQLVHGLRHLTDRDTADRDIADEVRHFIDEATESLISSGLSPAEARRRARLEYGAQSTIREQVRSYGWESTVEDLLADLRYAARRLWSEPGFAIVGVLTVALGVGAVTTILGAVEPVLLEPLPYPQADRVMVISDFAADGSPLDVTFGTYREVAERSRSFQALAVIKPWRPALSGVGQPERLDGQRVSAGYFRVLGVAPALGQDFDPSQDRVAGPDVAIISDALWRGRFGGDSAIVGRRLTLDDDVYTVVGVMPRGFENVVAPTAEIWSLLQYDASLPSFEGREWGHHLRMVGRLATGNDSDGARRDLDRIAADPSTELRRPRWASLERGFHVTSLREMVTRSIRPALLAISGAVILLLLIACVNTTNLLLGRGVRRREEFAVRHALGAGGPRLIRQLLTESLLLAALGGGAGMALAVLGVRGLILLSPPELPRVDAIGIDGTVFAAALTITTLVGVVVGLVPARRAARSDPQSGLRQGARWSTGDSRVARGTLVVAEVALTLVLLVGAGLLLRSLGQLLAVDPGFEPARLLSLQVHTTGRSYRDDEATHRFFDRVIEAVRAVPGVREVGLTSQLPLSGESDAYGVHTEPARAGDPDGDRGAFRYAVDPSYFETMEIPLLRGRLLDERDDDGAPRAAIISESLARRRFPDRDPIGEQIQVGRTDLPPYTVVGVVGDVKQSSLALSEPDAVYVRPEQWLFADDTRWLVVRTDADAEALASAVKAAVWSVDPDQPIVRVERMEDLLGASVAQRRFALVVFAAFALAALVLAVIGLYGVLSGSVNERIREMGIRSALGATAADLVRLVVRQGLWLTGLGVVIGLAGAVMTSRILVTLLFGVSRLDPVTYGGVIVLLAAVSGLACVVPAGRAARVNPVRILNAE